MPDAQAGKPFFGTNNGRARIDQTGDKFVVSKGNIDVLLAGFDAKGNVVVKIAKDGIDVNKATDDQLIFNSAQNIMKIVGSDTITNTVSGSLARGASFTVSKDHNIKNVIPSIIGYLSGTGSDFLTPNTYYPLPYTIPIDFGSSYQPGLHYTMTVDDKKVYATVTNHTTTTQVGIGTAKFKYYLFQESAN